VLFCGSGVSASAGLPTWKQLLTDLVKQLAEEVPNDTSQAELRRLIDGGKLLEVADYCKEALGQPYYNALSKRLSNPESVVPELHKIITQLPFSSIVTTNYDKLLEWAYASARGLPKTPTHRDVDTLGTLLFSGSFFIFKAHGDIDRPDSMVLTTRDYQEIIHANPSFNAFFSALLLTKAILFVGYSLNDPDFRMLLDRQLTVFKGHVPERWALMAGLGKVEQDVLWRTAQIRVIPYDEGKHEQVLEFLSSLRDQLDTGGAKSTAAVAPGTDARGKVKVKKLVAPSVAPERFSLREEAEPALPPQAGCILSIGLHGSTVEASLQWKQHAIRSIGAELDRSAVTGLMRPALKLEKEARRLGELLSRCLPPEISGSLIDVPGNQTISLNLGAGIDLLPWEFTTIGGEFLRLRNPVVRMPNISNAARGYPNLRGRAGVLLIGDPNRNDGHPLEGAEREIEAIADVYGDQHRFKLVKLMGPDATYTALAAALATGDFHIVHFAGHAWFDELEPFLLLSKRVQLRASELRSMLGARPPAVLFLNTHYSLFVPPGASGEVPPGVVQERPDPASPSDTVIHGQRGFIEAASTSGVGTLIGTYSGNLDDATAEHVGVDFHKQFLGGKPAALALHDALLHEFSSTGESDERRVSCLTYAMSGYGELKLSER
jgi:hypothetical protein